MGETWLRTCLSWVFFWCLITATGASAEIAQLDRLRYSSEPDYTRIVLDLSAGIAAREVIPDGSKGLTLRIQPCLFNPAIPTVHTNLNSPLMKQIEFESAEGDALLMHIRPKVAVNARVFTMKSPDRVVMDLRPAVPSEPTSITPDPNRAAPLEVTPDPLDQILQTALTQEKKEEPEPGTEAAPTGEPETEEENPGPANEKKQTATPPVSSVESPQGENPDTSKTDNSQIEGVTVEQSTETGTPESPKAPPHTTPISEDRWTFSNPWIIGQLMLNAFLTAMILLLFRHAQKLNASLRLMRVKLSGLEESRTPSRSSGQRRVESTRQDAREERKARDLESSRVQSPPGISDHGLAADFERLLQNPTLQESDIRTATAHGRAREQSQQKRRSRPDSSALQSKVEPEVERGALNAERAANVQTRKVETAGEDLSFDELRDALSKISVELDRLIDAEEVADTPKPTGRKTQASQSRSPTTPARSLQGRVIELTRQGYEPIEISRALEIPRGEVELILSLHKGA